jgi:hypothetical protein
MAITLINVFSVPVGKEDEPESRYNFINVALLENEAVYWTAYEKSVTPMKAKLQQLGIEMVPALYAWRSNIDGSADESNPLAP